MHKQPHSSVIRHLFSRGQPLLFGKGDIILGNEPEPNGVYYISSGYVKIYSIGNDGDEYLHIVYGQGEIFPIVWAYINIESSALFYEALSDCNVWRMSREVFNKYLESDHEFAYAMSVQLAQQLRIHDDRLDNLEYKKAEDRIVYRLLFLANRFGHKERNTVVMDVPITHEIFANSINLARESVSRHLEKLVKAGLISMSGSRIVILDIEALVGKLGSPPGNIKNWRF